MDLTIIFYTANSFENKLSAGVRENLLKVAGNYPIISVSQKPMDFGKNICVGEIGKSYRNLYKQILIGAKEATTEYVAMAEDDCLYTEEHFNRYRPNNAFAFNVTKWSLYTWVRPPMYSWKKDRKTTCAMIAPRKLLIEALEERYAKYPDDNNYPMQYWREPGEYEKQLGITVRPTEEFMTYDQILVFSHEYDVMGFNELGQRKRHGIMQAYDVAYWGRAEDIMKKYI